MAGFIVLEDGRAYAASNRAADAMIRAIAAVVDEPELKDWVRQQESEVVGMGMTYIDLREIAPLYRPLLRQAIRRAYLEVDGGRVDPLPTADQDYFDSWMARFRDLIEMLNRSEAGESPTAFNPHMRELLPATGKRVGPGWATAP